MSMGKSKISEYELQKAISKTQNFKDFIFDFKSKMNAFEYNCSAVRIKGAFVLDLTINFHHQDWEDDNANEEIGKAFEFDTTIANLNYRFEKGLPRHIAKTIARSVLDALVLQKVECYHIIDSIQADTKYWAIHDLWAWSSSHVGKYHIEQECGEGWITMPKEPQEKTRNFINLD